MATGKPRVNVFISEDTAEALRLAAFKLRVSQSQIVEDMIRLGIGSVCPEAGQVLDEGVELNVTEKAGVKVRRRKAAKK